VLDLQGNGVVEREGEFLDVGLERFEAVLSGLERLEAVFNGLK
jgi:hypothetical protein